MDYSMVLLDNRPLSAILVSLVAAALIMLSDKHPNVRESWTILASICKLAIVYSMLPIVLSGKVIETVPFHVAAGISLHLRVDATGMIFAALSSFLWLLTSIYSIGYMRAINQKHQTSYYACFAVCLSATIGIAFSANLLTFFVFYEILTIATYPLIIHDRDEEARIAGRKYLAYTLTAGQFLLIGIVWIYILVGNGDFKAGGFLTTAVASTFVLKTIFVFLIIGTGVKAGIMPFHGWLPSAMAAPSPVSALLHAVAVVKAGVFGVIRIICFVFGPSLLSELGITTILAWAAAFTIIVSSLLAIRQENLKARLAFSTVGQLSYIILAASLLTPYGILGGMYHIVAHAFMKITLFFCAGALYTTRRIMFVSEMNGIGLKMPYTMGAFAVCAFGITGLPFMAGFISKWNIALGSLQAGQGVFIAILIGSALLSTCYLVPIVYKAFFKEPDNIIHHQNIDRMADFGERDTSNAMLLPLIVAAICAVLLGVFPNLGAGFYDLAIMTADNIFGAELTLGGK